MPSITSEFERPACGPVRRDRRPPRSSIFLLCATRGCKRYARYLCARCEALICEGCAVAAGDGTHHCHRHVPKNAASVAPAQPRQLELFSKRQSQRAIQAHSLDGLVERKEAT